MDKSKKNILTAFVLNLFFSIIEFVGGLLSGSIAIVSDAIHDLGDSISIGFAYYLEKKSDKKADNKNTFGYLRLSVFGAFITNTILLVGSIFVIYESINRFIHPADVNPYIMLGLAIFGIIINGVATLKTKDGKGLNEKGISLHMLEDVLGWVVVLIGSIIMIIVDATFIDSILSLLVSIFILYNVVKNFSSIFRILMQSLPEGFNVDEYTQHLQSVEGVVSVHHLHIWTLDGQSILASFHAVVNTEKASDIILIKKKLNEESLEHNINHVTIQIEYENETCNDDKCDIKSSAPVGHHHH